MKKIILLFMLMFIASNLYADYLESLPPRPVDSRVWGFEIDQTNYNDGQYSSGKVTYTDSAVGLEPVCNKGTYTLGGWEDFINSIARPCAVECGPANQNWGRIVGYLDRNDNSKYEDGTSVLFDDPASKIIAMVEFRRLYMSVVRDTSNSRDIIRVKFSRVKHDDTYKDMAFLDANGNSHSKMFVYMFEGLPYTPLNASTEQTSVAKSLATETTILYKDANNPWNAEANPSGTLKFCSNLSRRQTNVWDFAPINYYQRNYINLLLCMLMKDIRLNNNEANKGINGITRAATVSSNFLPRARTLTQGCFGEAQSSGTGENNKMLWLSDWVGNRSELTLGVSLPSTTYNVATQSVFGNYMWQNSVVASDTGINIATTGYIRKMDVTTDGLFFPLVTDTDYTNDKFMYGTVIKGGDSNKSECGFFVGGSLQTSTDVQNVGNGLLNMWDMTYMRRSKNETNYDVTAKNHNANCYRMVLLPIENSEGILDNN